MVFTFRGMDVLLFISVAALIGTTSCINLFWDEQNECKNDNRIGNEYRYKAQGEGQYTAPKLGFSAKGDQPCKTFAWAQSGNWPKCVECKRPKGKFLTNDQPDSVTKTVICALVKLKGRSSKNIADVTKYSWMFKHEKSGDYQPVCYSNIKVYKGASEERNFTVESVSRRAGYDCKLYLNTNPGYGPPVCSTPGSGANPKIENGDDNPISAKLTIAARSCKTAGEYNMKSTHGVLLFSTPLSVTAPKAVTLMPDYIIEKDSPEKFPVICEVHYAGGGDNPDIHASVVDENENVLKENKVTLKSGDTSLTCKTKQVVKHTIDMSPKMIGKKVGCRVKGEVKWLNTFAAPSGCKNFFHEDRLECRAQGFPLPNFFLPEYSEEEDPEIICKINNGLGECEHRERVSEKDKVIQKHFKSCESSPCTKHGKCYNVFDDFTCKCDSGWSGKRCDDNVANRIIIIVVIVVVLLAAFIATIAGLCVWQRKRVRTWMIDRDVSTMFQSRLSGVASATSEDTSSTFSKEAARKPVRVYTSGGEVVQSEKAVYS